MFSTSFRLYLSDGNSYSMIIIFHNSITWVFRSLAAITAIFNLHRVNITSVLLLYCIYRQPFKKTLLSLKGISTFAGDFVPIWMKQRLIWFNLQRDETRNGLSNIKETFAENLQLQISVLHQSMRIFQGWSLKFIWYLVCQIPIKMLKHLKQHATPNSSLHNLKIYSAIWCRKTSQKWMCS